MKRSANPAASVLLALALASPLPARTEAAAADLHLPEVADVEVLALNVEMAEFLVDHVRASRSPTTRLYSLIDAVFDEQELGITYEEDGTKTAAEIFESRRGNCLSFTFLFVAMARHLGLDAYFQEVGEVLSWDRRGDVVLRNQHMYVEVEVTNSRIQVDFLPGAEKRYRQVRRISDQRALAHYYNNRGAEILARGDVRLAVAHFRKAIETDESFTHAWTNLGVAYRRLGRLELAEDSHLRAIETDPGELTAVSNLASLYLAAGRRAEAEPLLRRIEDYQKKNPFSHFRRGLHSLRNGDPAAAITHLKEAIRRLPEEPEFHAALARAHAQAGDPAKAEASLKKAIRLAEDDDSRERYHEELTALGAEGA